MDIALYFFIPALAIAALLANIGIWAPRRLWLRISALTVAAVFIPLSYASVSELLSRPKSVSLEWARRSVAEVTLLGASMREGKAIYLWLRMPGDQEPRAYVMPWNLPMAKQLQAAQRQARKNKNGVRVRFPFDGTHDPRRRMFYAPPQASLPPKPLPDATTFEYTRPDRGT